MNFNKLVVGGIALGASVVLVGTSALAATGVVYDPTGDAIILVDDEIGYGEYDIDLTRIDIDHGTKNLEIVSRFSLLADDSWTLANAEIDTTGDGVADYAVMWLKDEGVAFVQDAAERITCSSIGTRESLGLDGSLTLNIPRACIGSPARVAVHMDVLWAGLNTSDNDLYFVDSAPGQLVDDWTAFSAPVASSNTGTATSPRLPVPVPDPVPAAKTTIVAKLSKKTHRSGTKPTKVTVSVNAKGSAKPAGRVKIQLNGKVVKRAKVKAGKKVVHKLKRTMKPGRYKVKITFAPSDKKRFKKSSKTVTLRVKR